jgi:hypothetical protein
MREQSIHEKAVNIDNQKKKKYFSGLGDLSVLLSSPEREFLSCWCDREFIPDVVTTRLGSIEFPPDVAADTQARCGYEDKVS